jgi:hypothetical protein
VARADSNDARGPIMVPWTRDRGSRFRDVAGGSDMKHIAMISYAITALGVLLLAASIVADLSPLWQITGAMLIIAGGVKIAVVHIWQRLAGV